MRAAVIGANWGGVHVAGLREAGVEVVALVGRDPDRTRLAAEQLGIAAALTDPARLADLGVDLVDVATPASAHLEVVDALPPDVPVLCEKPAVGLTGPSELRARAAPVWVNYAFPFLEVAERAAHAVRGLGPVRAAWVRSIHDLPDASFSPEQMFFELVPHPWSWLVGLVGGDLRAGASTRAAPDAAAAEGDSVVVRVLCGETPVELACVSEPGLRGLRHEVVVDAEGGRTMLEGTYRIGQPWAFAAPRIVGADAEVQVLGDAEPGPGDPWYRANVRSIGAAVAAVRGEQADPRLCDWATAVAMDLTVRAGLSRREPDDAPG